ncbi:chromatin modification- protein VID21 [Coemansia sp. RSA 371]|nr:chromatin modification- protein VID21 [Coemansia sp. RSA 371]
MDVDTHNEDEFDTDHLTHPDDIVFQSQLDPVSVAQVLSKLSVHDAEVLENPMVYYSYQDQIEDLNSKSANMYNWMLHAQEQPLYKVIGDSSKLLETRDWDTVRDELIRVRVMERIEELKEQGKWSFWQPRRHRAPPRSKAHWDHVLAEMAWMHTDFAEERKLKVATARMLASWVMDYHQAIDKSRYTVNGKRRMLPANFVNSKAGDSPDSLPAEDDDMADSEDQIGSSPESLGEPDEGDEDEDAGETTDGESSTATGEAAAVPSSAPGSPSDRDTSETPLEALIKAEPSTEPLAQSKGVGDEGVNGFAAGAGLESVEDHVVPSGADKFDRPVLSVYQILAQLPDALGVEEILGNSVYALQALSAFVPFSPAWEEPYCDILDVSPVVPICKTMWEDIEDEDDALAGLDTSEETIDMHELTRLNSEDSWRTRTADSELPGQRSVFTRNMLAPPLLPIFTQPNKQQRITHSSIGQPPADTQIQQAASEACPGQAVFEWTAERDRMLAKLVQQYTGNWRLISESFNHASKLYGSRSVTSRVCFERWAAIKDDYSLDRSTVQTGFDEPDYNRSRKQQNWSSHLAIHPMVPQLSAMQLATSLVSHSEAHKVVNESKKKRESAATPAAVPPREIKPMAADQKVPTPAELSKLKFDNDRRLQQLFMEQRQATAAAAALAMQQQRSMNPQMQAFQLNRQIAVLQAMLASGRGLQRPLTPAQSRTIQQQLHNFQLMQQQQQAQQAQNGGMLARPPLPQQAAQASPQLQAVQSPQPQMPGLGQLPGGLGLPQQAQSPALPNGSQGMRLTPEQIQQFLQARSANGQQQSLAPVAAPGPHNLGMSSVPGDPTHTMHTSPVPSSMPNPQMGNLPGSTPASGALPGSGAGMTPAQAQAFLATQQAMQFKQMQGQQMQGQPMQGQPMPTQAAANQPQLAQYLSGLFPHQLAQLSNQQRMNFMMMRQLQQQQQQPQQFAGMTQPNTLQALQQSLMASAAGGNGLAGSPVSQQQQQMLLAQLAQNMNNQQMLKSTTQPPAQASPRPQMGLNQLQLMRMRQQQQQQQMGSGPPGFSIPTVSSPVMVNQATPSMSTQTFPAPQSSMSPPLHSSGSPPANTQPMMSPRPPQPVAGMQPSQQAMMLAAATAAGLSASAAQALIVQIAANAESNAQAAPVPAQVSPRPINSSASPVSTAQPHAMSVPTPQRTLSSASNVSSGAVTPSARPVTPQLAQRPSVRPALRPHAPRPPVPGQPGQPVQRSVRPGMRPPPGAVRRPLHPGNLSLPTKSPGGSAKGSESRGSTPSTPVKARPHVSPNRSTQVTASPEQAQSPDSSK